MRLKPRQIPKDTPEWSRRLYIAIQRLGDRFYEVKKLASGNFVAYSIEGYRAHAQTFVESLELLADYDPDKNKA